MKIKLGLVDQLIVARVKDRFSALPNGTVKMFLHVLTSKLTQYDAKETKREQTRGGQGNLYRLGHLLEAANKVEEDVKDYLDKDDEEAMEALRASLKKRFTPNFPPINTVLRQIDNWLTKKKKPSLI